MKKVFCLLVLCICVFGLMGQVPQRLSYQAVVRNGNNQLVARESAAVTISIGDAAGATNWYTESHNVTTNANGLISLIIGEGTPVSGHMKDVDWRNAAVKTIIVVGGETIENITPVTAVPYASYADSARTVDQTLINEQINQITGPVIRNLNVRISKVNLRVDSLGDKLTDTLQAYATQKALEDTAIAIRSAISSLDQVNADWEATEGPAMILHKPTIPDPQVNADWEATTGPAMILHKPTIPDPQVNADWNATTGVTAILNKPDLSVYVKTEDIPTKVSVFENDVPYVTKRQFDSLIVEMEIIKQRLDSAINEMGGDEIGCGTVTDKEKNKYQTVIIGKQCWMKENLRATKYANGKVVSKGSITSSSTAYWYYPNNTESNKRKGLLYNWKTVQAEANLDTICPSGWHVPSVAEWQQLIDTVKAQSQYKCGSSSDNIAKSLASKLIWGTSSNTCAVGNAPEDNDDTEFSMIPAGYYGGSYMEYGSVAYCWSATPSGDDKARIIRIEKDDATVSLSSGYRVYGFPIRCVKVK